MSELQERKRQAVAGLLQQAALRGLSEHGVDVTVDEIAQFAGVSRRTVFRHFATRDDLLAAAVRAWYPDFNRSLPRFTSDVDWRASIADLSRIIHATNAAHGHVLWELMTRQDLSAQLAAVAEEIARYRRERNHAIADTLWRALGHGASAPEEFRGTVMAHLSPFFTVAVDRDAGGDPGLAAALATAAILAASDQHSVPESAPALAED
jgi:AcrR family transcriptional regulator